MKVLVFIGSLLCITSLLQADDNSYAHESLKFETRYYNAISKSAVALQHYFDKYPESDHESIMLSDNFLNNVLKKELYEIAEVYTDQIEIKRSKKEWIRAQLSRFSYKQLKSTTAHLLSNRSFYLRKYGLGVMAAFLAGSVANVVIPFLLPQLGLTVLVPVSLAFPFGTVFAGALAPIDIVSRWKKEKKALGKRYSDYVKMRKGIRKHLMQVSDFDFLFPVKVRGLVTDKNLVIQRTSFIDEVFAKVRIFRERSNFYTIKKFIKDNHFEDKFTKWIITKSDLDKEEKAILLVHHIFESDNEKIQSAFITEFSNFFISRPKLPRTRRLKEWTKVLISSKNGQDVARAMTLIPPGVPPLVIIQIWEELALPQLIKKTPMKVGAYIKIKRELEVLRGISSSKAHRESWNLSFMKLFNQKISPLIKGMKRYCHKSQKDLFHELLNSPF